MMRASPAPRPTPSSPALGGLSLKMLADPPPPGWSLSCEAASGHLASIPTLWPGLVLMRLELWVRRRRRSEAFISWSL